jgi:hypothetical protein
MASISYLGIFVALVGLAGLVIGLRAHGVAKARAAAATRWMIVPGVVTRSEIAERTGQSAGTPYSYFDPLIAYTYSVGGRTRSGQRLRFGAVSARSRKAAEAMLAPYPVGATIDIHYDPDDPDESALEPGTVGASMLAVAILSGVVILVGLAITASGLR